MRRQKYKFRIVALVLLISVIISENTYLAHASVVSKRISQVKAVYPHNSKMNEIVVSDGIYNAGCNGLVAYTTLKVFHSAWIPNAKTYKKVGKTTSVTSFNLVNKLFKKAKIGDVVVFRTGSGRISINKLKHTAIFLSKTNSGIRIYEANYGSSNLVWYNHFWSYYNFKSWSRGATKVEIYRAKNYNSVNKKKSAKILKIGKKFKVNGITYKVLNNKIGKGSVKVVRKSPDAGRTPKAIGLNDGEYTEYTAIDKLYICDQQYFKVKK